MVLSPGIHLGAYEILSHIGSGGMGEVYRAKDTKLGREVALKILPNAFTDDPERLARFRREAQVLASLNHPRIGAIYGLDDANGQQFLVLELVDGDSLDKRIARGKLPVDEALAIAKQIAEALEAAHEKGIIHRDLKPANIALTADGTVKLLDFGLAKAMEPMSATSFDLANSPTITSPAIMTDVGMFIGTAAYMSPEQARGSVVNKRADVWAFGCVLYEMLTGTGAFGGDHATDIVVSLMRDEPKWHLLPSHTPAPVRRLLRRCLEKDPRSRLRDIGDAQIELREVGTAGTIEDAAEPVKSSRRSRHTIPWLTAIVMTSLGGSVIVWSVTRHGAPRPAERLTITLPSTAPILAGSSANALLPSVKPLALSPDGTRLVYVGSAYGKNGSRLYMRALATFEPHAVDGTDGASAPFFSPDGQVVGFFAGGKLKRVSLVGGTVTTICDAPEDTGGSGGTWGPDDTIVFAISDSARSGLFRVSASGGTPEVVTTPDPTEEGGHSDPSFVVGARAVLFTTRRTKAGVPTSVRVLSLATGQHHKLVEGDSRPMYVGPGYLTFGKAGAVMAAPFNVQTLQLTGSPVTVVENVLGLNFDVSSSGRFVYVGALPYGGTLVWVDRRGSNEALIDDTHVFGRPRLSPDGSRLVAEVLRESRSDIGVYRFDNRTLTLLTTDGVSNSPYWHPDGHRIVFRSRGNLFWQSADAPTARELLLGAADPALKATSSLAPGVFSPDGSVFTFVVHGSTGTGADIWRLHLGRDGRVEPLVQRRGNQWGVRVSPDGRWISYASDESGRFEMYIESTSSGREKRQVSSNGGVEGVWSPAASELFYREGDRMMVVPIANHQDSPVGTPQVLFKGRYVSTDLPHYDVTRDGTRFVMVKPIQDDAEGRTIRVIENWFEELKARVPAK